MPRPPIPPDMLEECRVCGWELGYGPATHRYFQGHDFVKGS